MTKNRNRKQAVRRYQQTHDVPYLKAARHHDTTTPLPSVPGDLPDMLPFPEPGSREFDEAIRLARDGILRIGIDDTGQWVDWDLNSNPHGLISGKTGSGKTQLLTAIAFYAAWLPDEYELVVCDPKGTDLTWTAGASNVVWYAATAVEIPEAIAYVRKQIIERQERSRSTQRNGSSEPAPPRLILLINDLTVVLANSSESMDGPTKRAR
ncbi:MAG: hypothetical protein L0H59_11340, partial [Tomitella sp.]|nr:hypothetical protein [Tomitella sp.]